MSQNTLPQHSTPWEDLEAQLALTKSKRKATCAQARAVATGDKENKPAILRGAGAKKGQKLAKEGSDCIRYVFLLLLAVHFFTTYILAGLMKSTSISPQLLSPKLKIASPTVAFLVSKVATLLGAPKAISHASRPAVNWFRKFSLLLRLLTRKNSLMQSRPRYDGKQ